MGIKIKNPFRTNSGQVTRAATDATAARQGRASNLAMAADQWYSDPARENQRNDFMGALRSQLSDNTTRGFTDLARGTKFATARQGLTGGRVDVDRQNRNLEDLFRRRIADEAQVQDAGQQMRAQDLATRQQMLDAAYGAADIGQGATRNMVGQQAQNAQYLSTLLPQFVWNMGAGIAQGYSNRANQRAFLEGLGGNSNPYAGLAGLTIAPNARTTLPEGW
jgi:hypothetical protein